MFASVVEMHSGAFARLDVVDEVSDVAPSVLNVTLLSLPRLVGRRVERMQFRDQESTTADLRIVTRLTGS